MALKRLPQKRDWKPGEEPLRGDIFVSAASISSSPVARSIRLEVNVVLHTRDVADGGLPVMANVELNQFDSDPIQLEMEVALDDAVDVVQAIVKNKDAILSCVKPGWIVLRGQVVGGEQGAEGRRTETLPVRAIPGVPLAGVRRSLPGDGNDER